MKSMVKLFFLFSCVAALFSCAKIDNSIADDLGLAPAEIGVNIGSGSQTRTYLGESDGESTPLYWSDDEYDQITVNIDGTKYTFQKVGVTSKSQSATFRCDAVPAVVPGKTYTARYDYDGTSNLYITQMGPNRYLKNYLDMTATYLAKEGDTWEDVVFNFEIDKCVLKITLEGDYYNQKYLAFTLYEGEEKWMESTGSIVGADGRAEAYFVVEPKSYNNVRIDVTILGEDVLGSISCTLSDNTLVKGNIYHITKGAMDFVSHLQKDLSQEGRANCYIVNTTEYNLDPKNYLYKFSATHKGGSSDEDDYIASDITSVQVLWESVGSSSEISKGDIVSRAFLLNDNIYFFLKQPVVEGNAVIGAFDENGEIVWSWHIWITDKPSEQAYKGGGDQTFGIYMDRNLGATDSDNASNNVAGLLYQWGRKDPFLSTGDLASSSNQRAACAINDILSWNTVASDATVGTIEYAVQNPTTFISGVSPNFHWLNQHDITLWSNRKTIYDPCPAGWKVAQSELGANFGSYVFEVVGKCAKISYDNSNYAYYPAAGSLNFQTGALEQTGSAGYLWSSTVASNGSSYGFYFDENLRTDWDYKFYSSQGASVRCEKIE